MIVSPNGPSRHSTVYSEGGVGGGPLVDVGLTVGGRGGPPGDGCMGRFGLATGL